MRSGVNAGSLERYLLERYGEPCPEAMVESALNHAKILEDNDFFEFKISCKASDVFLAVAAYQQLAEACNYPLRLGITEAGALRSGTVKSSIGLGMLLWSGIGDTIRVSLSVDPVEEVKAGFEILKSSWGKQAPLGWDSADSGPVADVAVFLLSDLARAVTGEMIHVDGGYHSQGAPLIQAAEVTG